MDWFHVWSVAGLPDQFGLISRMLHCKHQIRGQSAIYLIMTLQAWTLFFRCFLCEVKSIDLTSQPFYNESPCEKTKTVDYLVMAPFPDPTGLDPGEDTGPILIPAAMAAANSTNQRCDILGDYRIRVLVADSGYDIIIPKAISSLVNATFDPQYHVWWGS